MMCPKRGGERNWRNGFEKASQRYLCRDCGLNFTENTDLNKIHKDIKPPKVRKLAETLYLKGSSARDIKEIILDTFEVLVSVTTILDWIQKKRLKIQENKEIETQIKQAKLLTDQAFDIVECDEMWSFIQNKKSKCWIWLAICRVTKLILGFALGGRGAKI